MGDYKSDLHLNQTVANILGDVRLSDAEKVTAQALAVQQHARLQDGSESDPDTWEAGRVGGLGTLANAAAEYTIAHAGEMLGNVFALNGFIRGVAWQLGYPVSEAERLVELALRPSSGSMSRDEQADLDAMLDRVRLRSRDVWVFRNDGSPTAPYVGGNLNEAPCTLGLPYRTGERFVAFSLPADVLQNGRRPCAYDADWRFQEFWRPDGHTKPICIANPKDQGYPEWITDAPRLSEIGRPFLAGIVEDCPPDGTDCYG